MAKLKKFFEVAQAFLKLGSY